MDRQQGQLGQQRQQEKERQNRQSREARQSQETRQGQETRQSQETRQQGAVYQGAFESVIAILVSGGIGYWLDGYFDTEPILLFIGLAIGFASFTVRLVRLGRSIHQPDSTDNESDE